MLVFFYGVAGAGYMFACVLEERRRWRGRAEISPLPYDVFYGLAFVGIFIWAVFRGEYVMATLAAINVACFAGLIATEVRS